MTRARFLGFLNLVFFLWFMVVLGTTHPSLEHIDSFYAFFKEFAPFLILSIFVAIHAHLLYLLLWQPIKKSQLFLMTVYTITPFAWFLYGFICFFFASHLLVPISGFVIALGLYLSLRRYSKASAIFLSIGTLIVVSVVLVSSFEEDYCINKGITADPSGVNSIAATKEDAKLLSDFNVKTDMQIGKSFRVQMLCHHTFNAFTAVTDTLVSHHL